MKVLPAFLWLLALSLITAAEPPVIDIPKVAESGWPRDGYHAEVLTPVGAPAEGIGQLSLGWTENGLLIRVEARDDTPIEAAEDKDLWTADSVEIFVASAAGSKDRFQLLASAGRPAGKPRFSVVDQRAEKPEAVIPVIAAIKNENFFSVDLQIPWTSFVTPPKAGDVIGLQVYLNDGKPGKTARQIWFPKVANPALMYPVRLAEKASPPQRMAASVGIERGREVVLDVIATAASAGEQVEVEIEGTRTAAGLLKTMNPDESRLHWALPDEIAGKAGAPIRIFVAGKAAAGDLVVPDLAEARRKLLDRARFVASNTVFSSSRLPSVNFEEQELAEAAFGNCEITTRYFDADGNEVTQAEKPGRYGALTTIRTPDGTESIRRITLFKTAKPYSNRTDLFDVRLGLPEALGLPADITEKENSMVQAFANYQLGMKAGSLGSLVAGLHDIAADPEKYHGNDYANIDGDWWRKLDRKLGTAKPYQYLLDLPKDYDADPQKAWPLLLFLHGSGERGNDVNAVAKHGPPKLVRNGQELPFIIVSPQCPPNEWWCAETLTELLDEVSAKYRVDPKRVYVTGLSMGGYGTWALAAKQPERFAAIAPVCGAAYPELAARIQKIPIWVFHGEKDEAVPVKGSTEIVKALENLKAPVKLTVYPGVGHDSWTQTYENAELFDWLLQQQH